MPSLHVLSRKEDLEPARLGGRIVIVLDILFATSTIVHAFAEGTLDVWPTLNSDEASGVASGMADHVIAGEYLAQPIPGFASAMPLLLSREGLRGKPLVYCTTNGTVALRRAVSAAFVYAGALLNGAALAAHVARAHPNMPVLVVCAGSLGRFSLEDFYGAGHIVSHLDRYPGYELSDAARAAMLLCRGSDARTALLGSRIGRLMQSRDLTDEVEYAARRDTLDVIARWEAGRLRRIDA
jgi:2-phosphosulfolactate phosphatase